MSTTELDIAKVVAELGEEEKLAVLVLAKRILFGQKTHGVLDLANDPRDFKKERAEEAQDLLCYTAYLEVQRQIRGQ